MGKKSQKFSDLSELADAFGIDRQKPVAQRDNRVDYRYTNNNNRYGGYGRNNRNERLGQRLSAATAAYNFISLPDAPLPSSLESEHAALLDREQGESQAAYRKYIIDDCPLSGEIRLELISLTPFFIGGNRNSDSFSPVGTPIIPGSTLRGMVKNIFKIVTLSTLRGKTATQIRGYDITDRHVYYRCLMASRNTPAWMKPLNALYNSRMTETVKGTDGRNHIIRKAKPGFLLKSKGKYYIAPSKYVIDRPQDRILITEYRDKFGEDVGIRDTRVTWHGNTAYIITGSQPDHRLKTREQYDRLLRGNPEELKRCGKQLIRYISLEAMNWARDQWLEVPDEVLNEYRHDKNRRGVNLLSDKRTSGSRTDGLLKRDEIKNHLNNSAHDDIINQIDTLVPCHYLIEDGKLTAFGHGQCFRIPFKQRIADGVPERLNSDTIDFTDAVFGREKYWASKVYFDDAVPMSEPETIGKAVAHPMMTPNPTSYQLYLRQPNGDELQHWDIAGMQLRGYKMYWHNRGVLDWKATADEIELDKNKPTSKKLTRTITPIKKNSTFFGKIRFKNLSPVELGALLTVFDLCGNGDKCAYKLGTGKPWGFGSFRIAAQLYVDADGKDYGKIFDGDGAFCDPSRAQDGAAYIMAFQNYIRDRGRENEWCHIMNELCDMLDWDSIPQRPDWANKIKSMSGNVMQNAQNSVDERFRQRTPLPTVAEVLAK